MLGESLSSSPGSSSSQYPAGPVSQKKRVLIGSACDACRRCKTRCDKTKPTCIRCVEIGRVCKYSVDGRSLRGAENAPTVLQARIVDLEARLDAALSVRTNRLDTLSAHSSNAPSQTRWVPGGSLSLSSYGALRYHDPTSSFFRTHHPNRSKKCRMLPSSPSGNLTPPSIEVNYLPIQLDHQLHRHIIDLAFSRILGYGSFAREVDFKTDLGASPLLRTSNYTPFVHLAVLAIGCRYLSPDKHHLVCPPGVDYEQRGQIFAEAAQEMLRRDGAEPDLAFIRGVTVLLKYMVGMGQDNLAVMYQGIATTVALDFRLHLAFDPSHKDPNLPNNWRTICDDRIKLFATLSCVDVMWSAYLGRESDFPRMHVTQANLPIPLDPQSLPLVDLALAYHSRLAVISSLAIEEIYTDPILDIDSHIKACLRYLEELDYWFQSLPSSLRLDSDISVTMTESHVCTLIMFHYAVRILLCQPFIGTLQEHRYLETLCKACEDATWQIVRIIRLILASSGPSSGPLNNQDIAFIAGGVLVLLASGHFPHTSSNSTTTQPKSSDESVPQMTEICRRNLAVEALKDICSFLRNFGLQVWPNPLQSTQTLETLLAEFAL